MRGMMAVVLLLITLAGGSASAAGTPLPRNTSRYDFSQLTPQLQAFITDNTVTGMVMIVVKDGEVIYEHAFGTYTLATDLSIASASKMPSSLAVMKLVDSGALKLDDLVSKYIPNWPADKAAMKVSDLMANLSGFPFDQTYVSDGSITMEQAVQQISQMTLLFEPGTSFCYNPNGFHVAARIAEIVSGKPFATHFKDTLFDPLGMEGLNYNSQTNPWAAGGIQSNAEDYAKILTLHLNQGWWPTGRLYKPGTIATMQQDFLGDKPVVSSPAPNWHYGLSWWLSTPPAGEPVTEISDQGAFGATPWLDLKRGYGAFILIRKSTPTGTQIWNAVRPIINGVLDAANEPPQIRLHPQGASAAFGDSLEMAALGKGRGPLTYQWQKNGVDIPGATKSWLPLNNLKPGDGGIYRVIVSNSLGSATSNDALLTLPNSVPVIQSGAAATPNPARVGEAVVFSVAATDAEGDALSGTWNFSDGVAQNGMTASRSFSTAGTFSATASVSDGKGGSVSSTMTIVVEAGAGGGGGGGAPLDPDGDADGDGVSNGNELASGSDPLDAHSFIRLPLTITKLQGTVRYDVAGKDACSLSAILPNMPAGFSPQGLTLKVSVGGAEGSFVLDDKGKAKTPTGTAVLKAKTRGKAPFAGGDVTVQIKMKGGSWAAAWSDELAAQPATLDVLLTLNGNAYGAAQPVLYTGKAGKSGRFKK